MTHDSVYVANVSSALLGALHAAQDMVDAGEVGEPLADIVRHARELHEIMVEELGSPRPSADRAGRSLREMGERLRSLERLLAQPS